VTMRRMRITPIGLVKKPFFLGL
jgi:hypothetical protein